MSFNLLFHLCYVLCNKDSTELELLSSSIYCINSCSYTGQQTSGFETRRVQWQDRWEIDRHLYLCGQNIKLDGNFQFKHVKQLYLHGTADQWIWKSTAFSTRADEKSTFIFICVVTTTSGYLMSVTDQSTGSLLNMPS